MKKARKLLPAIAMLLISAVMMSTASFAWFSMNTEVSANGMDVNATTAKNLVITNTKNSNESDEATSLVTGVKTLKPTSTADVTNFFKVDSNVNVTTGALKDGSVVTAVEEGEKDEYYVVHTFYIRVDGKAGEEFANLYVSEITVGGASKNISKALRVGVVSGTTKLIFAPVSGATTAYRALDNAGPCTSADDTAVLTDSNITLATLGEGATLGEVTTEYVTVNIYLWYEGQDASCTTANSVNAEDLSVTVKFAGAN